MLDAYERLLNDPELMSLQADLALVSARIDDLLGRVDLGKSGSLMEQITATVKAMQAASAAKDMDKFANLFRTLIRLTTSAHTDYAAWQEIHRLIDQRRRLMESEAKRIARAKAYLRLDEAETLLTAILVSVKEHVRDRGALVAIQGDILRLVGKAPDQQTPRGEATAG